MRTVRCPAAFCVSKSLIELRGTCRACKVENVVRIARGHLVTLLSLACEHCGSKQESKPVARKKEKRRKKTGIAWHGSVFRG